MKDRYGSDSRWTYVSLKIGREMNWIEGLHKEQWIGSLICQAAALNGFTQMKDLGFLCLAKNNFIKDLGKNRQLQGVYIGFIPYETQR